MHPILFDRYKQFWYFCIWAVATALLLALTISSEAWNDVSAAALILPLSLCYSFVCLSAYYVSRALPIARRTPISMFAGLGGACLVAGLLVLTMAIFWSKLLGALELSDLSVELGKRARLMILVVGMGTYLLSILGHDLVIASENIRSSQQREAELTILAREAELQFLRSQINPHFLFNSLNSISALSAIDPMAAREMAISLAQFFRQSLAMGVGQKISLNKELELCHAFIEIEKIRFGSKLKVEMSIEASACEALIPPMLLQPLLENAIKHGVQNSTQTTTVSISVKRDQSWLYILVSNPIDDGTFPSTPREGSGTGLENIRRRCMSAYNNRARFTYGICQVDDIDSFVTELQIPLELDQIC